MAKAANDRGEAYKLGVNRGRATGRREPWDRDWQWLADETDGRIQTDPDDCHEFACGMRDGAIASEAEEDEPRHYGFSGGEDFTRGT